MRAKILYILFFSLSLSAWGSEPWKLWLGNAEEKVVLRIDLNEETVTVPGMEMFGPQNGYLGGPGVYGVWTVTSFKVESDKTATLRLSNDLGSETQSIVLTQQTDSTYLMELKGGVVVKRAVNRKLVKIPQKMELHIEQ